MTRGRAAGWLVAALGCGAIDEPSTEPAGEPDMVVPAPMIPASLDAPRDDAPSAAGRSPVAPADEGPIESSCPFGYRSVVEGDGTAVCEPPAVPAAVARERFKEGIRMYEVGDYEGALAAFRDVQSLHPLPPIAFDIATTLEHLGRHDEARRELRRLLDDPATPKQVREQAEALLSGLADR